MTKKKVHLVSHVHWDPAWYQPVENYRIMLIKFMGRLLDTLDSQPNYQYFHLDGQVSIVDDYLEIIPEDEQRIITHIKSGRLVVGPWYIQPEEFMISGEAHIRNLQLGIKRAKELGGVGSVSYLCDMVGHLPQMPQIISGFGIKSFCGWRGVIDGKDRTSSEFIWQAPNGSEVLFQVLPLGYCSFIPDDPEGFANRIDYLIEELSPFTEADRVLITCGDDHKPLLENLTDLISAYNEKCGDEVIEQTTLQRHIDYINQSFPTLPKHAGEFRSTFNSFILTGIISTRMDVKLKSESVSRNIERYLEPYSALNEIIAGAKYPSGLIDHVWKKQIKNAFHDCIYGASVDAVLVDTLNDYKRISEITTWIQNENLFSLSSQIATANRPLNVTVFNPTFSEGLDFVCDIEFFIEGEKHTGGFDIFDQNDSPVANQVNRICETLKYSDMAGNHLDQRDPLSGFTYHVSVTLPHIPAFGYLNLGINKTAEQRIYKTDLHDFENRFLKVMIKENGLLDVFDKETKKTYTDLHIIEDGGDFGDNYNYSKPENDIIVSTKDVVPTISCVASGSSKTTYKLEWKLALPKTCEDRLTGGETVINRITSYVTLRSNAKQLEFKTVVENNAENHRIRVKFPTGLASKTIYSGSQFYINERSAGVHSEVSFIEEPLGNYPHRQFVDISDGKTGVSFFDRGFPEYYATDKGDLYITLLRCTGYLSKEKLPERNGPAGPKLATPDSQLKGSHTFEYALYFHEGDYRSGKCVLHSDRFYAPLLSAQNSAHEGSLPLSLSFMGVDNDAIMLSAFKKSQDGKGFIVRLYNMSSESRDFRFSFIKPIKEAYLTDFNEQITDALGVSENGLALTIGKYEVLTVMIMI